MKQFLMTRKEPEEIGGPTSASIPECSIDILKSRGWILGEEILPTSEPPAVDKSELIAKALELDLATEEELSAMTEEELTQAIADASDDSDSENNSNADDKDSLIAKALELKLAPQSSLARMSVKKLTELIAKAQE